MKTKNLFKSPVDMRIILFLPVLLLMISVMVSCAAGKKSAKTKTGDVPYVVVEEMPMFPGGDSALLSFIAMNTRYPETAKTNNIQGRVIARFCVTSTGSVDRVNVLKGVSPEIDQEAIRVVSSLPAFKPGKQGGKPVSVWYMVPITFALGPQSPDKNKAPAPAPAEEKPGTEPLMTVDRMPVFPGGDTTLLRYIAMNTKYPESAKIKSIQGKVIVKFAVDTDGSIKMVSIQEGVDPDLNAESIRVVKSLPKFEPGQNRGKPVAVWYFMPITFALK
jgi:TonB family protein